MGAGRRKPRTPKPKNSAAQRVPETVKTGSPAAMGSGVKWGLIAAACVVGVASAVWFAQHRDDGSRAAADRSPQTGNLRYPGGADDGYIDASACAGCHQEIAASYAKTGMGRSFYRPTADSMAEPLKAASTYYHEASGRYYQVVERGGRYYQTRHQKGPDGTPVNVVEKEVHYVMGSGNHARTLLHQTPEGKIVEMPLGWYAERGGFWAMNPGYDSPRHRGFRREINFDCMFCHNGYPEMAPGEDASGREPVFAGRIPEGIDCQRCHGPGRKHIEAVSGGKAAEEIRAAIVNPARIAPERQLEVCMQCHLESTSRRLPYAVRRFDRPAFSFRPGEPLADYILHFDHPKGVEEDKFEIAHAAYRLRKSECFQQTASLPAGEAMTCTTCHDPHNAVRGREASEHYTAVCQGCHAGALHAAIEGGKHTASNECIDCHMPKRRTDDVVHVVMTDHFIQRYRPNRDLLAPSKEYQETDENAYHGEVALYYPPNLPDGPETDLYLAVAQVDQGTNLKGGIPRLENALVDSNPEAGEFHFELAEAYWKSGRRADAIRQYQRALQLSPEHMALRHNLSVALSESGRIDEAVKVLLGALDVSPSDSKSLNNLGELYLRQGRLPEAVDVLRKALRANPGMPEANSMLAAALSRMGDSEGAITAAEDAIRWQPDYDLAHNTLANMLADAGRFSEAQPHFEEAIRLNPTYAEAFYNYGSALAQQGRMNEAEKQLRRAVRLKPDFAQAENNLGNALAVSGRLAEAEQHFRNALKHDPKFADAAFNLGMARGTQGDHSQAKRYFEEAVRLDARHERAQFNLGAILAAEGDLDQARKHLEIAAKSADPQVRQAAAGALSQINTAGTQ